MYLKDSTDVKISTVLEKKWGMKLWTTINGSFISPDHGCDYKVQS